MVMQQIRNVILFSLLSVFNGLIAANAGEVATKSPEGSAIISLRAFLYYQDRGEFSGEDLLSGKVALRNVIIGAGTSKGPSGSMLVLVGVMHASFGHKIPASTLIRLAVNAGEKIISTHEVTLRSFFSERQKIDVPFIVHRTGCEPLVIRASLVEENRITSALSGSAQFHCGE
jgi:hypothetical protein